MVFKHSVKLPHNYKHTARILKEVKEDNRGLKDSVYSKNASTFERNKQRNMALATKILEKIHQIDHILRSTQILTKEPRLDPWIARVLIHELIWRKDLNSQCTPVQIIVSYKQEIHDALATYKEDVSLQPKNQVIKPRYARVNTFKMSVADVINQFRNEGLTFLPLVHETYAEYLEAVANLEPNHFMIDFHIKEMLVFHPKFFRYSLNEDCPFILQDKASCLTPLMLDPPPGSVVLDMCAAPGMKTNYLANLVGEKGRVYAVERDGKRYQTMSNLLNMQGLKNVCCMHGDALRLNGNELSDVEYILVDPSCSGSGIKGRIEFENSRPQRLKHLSNFQATILRHALSHFPNAKRVAYSTCSIHPEENEEVIVDVLNLVSEYQLVNLQEKMGNNWNNFGSEKYGAIGTSCLYSKDDDFTNGFFVALFERKTETNEKKRKYDEFELHGENNEEQNLDEKDVSSKKKKKTKDKTNDNTVEENGNFVETIVEIKEKKKKKKGKTKETEELYGENNEEQNVDEKDVSSKKKKKTKDETNDNTVEENGNFVKTIVEVEEKKKKKKGKRKKTEKLYGENNEEQNVDEKDVSSKMKKKTKDKTNDNIVEENGNFVETIVEGKEKKKKKKGKTKEIEKLYGENNKKKEEKTFEKIENTEEHNIEVKKKKKKKIQTKNTVEEIENMEEQSIEIKEKKKKSKKDKHNTNI